ncbi:hypothetical protein KGF56_002458 [Candida oxycetoniae]|uniref:Nucleolar protein 19 n=1 Tax=Candida oxycetoniae TaxID=497107 RepID=A0AAI9WY81_9ASCO|nr:uncharacterized protein KGF56_002458 [Candida oxycetoniae]KAI3404755.2 hypothetical protein KGF56_002458 [Candida oxycetoniae]
MASNRREEIKKKQELQAKFQFSIAQNNARVLNWLQPVRSDTTTTTITTTKSKEGKEDQKDDFLNLQVIAPGATLSFTKNTQTVGDFLNSKDLTRTSESNKANQQNGTGDNFRKYGENKAMNALLNKIRNENREKIRSRHNSGESQKKQSKREDYRQFKGGSSNNSSGVGSGNQSTLPENDSDSDPDLDAVRSRSVKKTNIGRVGKKSRPF